jgi:hypothetical protein
MPVLFRSVPPSPRPNGSTLMDSRLHGRADKSGSSQVTLREATEDGEGGCVCCHRVARGWAVTRQSIGEVCLRPP